MGITFNSSAISIMASNNLASSLLSTLLSARKLSSGLRINSAAYDPAGLVISENLRSQIGSVSQQIRNISSNISKYQTTSATVLTLRSSLTDLRAIAVGAANEGGNNESAQAAYGAAADSLTNTFNSIVEHAEYNGSKTLDGSDGSLANIAQLTGIDLSKVVGAEAALVAIDSAAAELDAALIDIGSTQRYDLEARQNSLEVTRQNLIAAESQLRDTDFLTEYANFIGFQIRAQASLAMLAHSNLIGATVLELFRD